MFWKIVGYVVAVVLIIVTGCGSDNGFVPTTPGDNGEVSYSIDTDVSFKFDVRLADRNSDISNVTLIIETVKWYPCGTEYIVCNLVNEQDLVIVELKEIRSSFVCMESGPARAYVPLGPRNGEFELVLANGNVRDVYELNLHPNSVKTQTLAAQFSKMWTVVWRYESN